jgi:hypothetical protein
MGEFLQNNWFWILLLVLFFWMHGSGMGCGGHGGHGGHGNRRQHDDDQDDNRAASTGHRH